MSQEYWCRIEVLYSELEYERWLGGIPKKGDYIEINGYRYKVDNVIYTPDKDYAVEIMVNSLVY